MKTNLTLKLWDRPSQRNTGEKKPYLITDFTYCCQTQEGIKQTSSSQCTKRLQLRRKRWALWSHSKCKANKNEVGFNSSTDLLHSFYLSTGQANRSTSATQLTGSGLFNPTVSALASSILLPSFLLRQSGCLLCLITLYGQLIDLIIKEKRITLGKSFTENFWIEKRTADHKSVQKNHCPYCSFFKKKNPNPQVSRIWRSKCPLKFSRGNKCLSSVLSPHKGQPFALRNSCTITFLHCS